MVNVKFLSLPYLRSSKAKVSIFITSPTKSKWEQVDYLWCFHRESLAGLLFSRCMHPLSRHYLEITVSKSSISAFAWIFQSVHGRKLLSYARFDSLTIQESDLRLTKKSSSTKFRRGTIDLPGLTSARSTLWREVSKTQSPVHISKNLRVHRWHLSLLIGCRQKCQVITLI